VSNDIVGGPAIGSVLPGRDRNRPEGL